MPSFGVLSAAVFGKHKAMLPPPPKLPPPSQPAYEYSARGNRKRGLRALARETARWQQDAERIARKKIAESRELGHTIHSKERNRLILGALKKGTIPSL